MASIGRMVKETIVSGVAAQLKKKSNVFIASVDRLPASEANIFRQKLHGSQAQLIMIKRRLGKHALADLKISGIEDLLKGSVGFILPSGDDVLPTAKALVEFGKAHQEQMSIQGDLIDGQLLDGKAIKALAELPSKPVLLAQVLGTIEAPMADVIFTIERLIGDLAWIAEEASKAKPGPGGPGLAPASAPGAEAGSAAPSPSA